MAQEQKLVLMQPDHLQSLKLLLINLYHGHMQWVSGAVYHGRVRKCIWRKIFGISGLVLSTIQLVVKAWSYKYQHDNTSVPGECSSNPAEDLIFANTSLNLAGWPLRVRLWMNTCPLQPTPKSTIFTPHTVYILKRFDQVGRMTDHC